MTDWDARWMALAGVFAGWSKDPSTKVGCVAVGDGRRLLSVGYNGFPRGVDDNPARYSRPVKYMFTEHAERNLIYNAARNGTDLWNSVMYITLYPCADCARGIIQAGVSKVITPEPDWNLPGWTESFDVAKIMLREAGVRVRYVTSPSREFARAAHHAAYRDAVERQFGNWDEADQDDYFAASWDDGECEIIIHDGIPCGYWQVRRSGSEIFLCQIALLPEFQGKGIGSSLLAALQSEAREKNVPVRLQVLKVNRAVALYERAGFRVTSESENHRQMEWQLRLP